MANPIGRRIREVREDYGMSQVELARRLGISRQNLNNIEHERSMPSPPLIKRIAELLRVNGNYLLGLTDDKDIPALLSRGVLTSVAGEINTPTLAPTLP